MPKLNENHGSFERIPSDMWQCRYQEQLLFYWYLHTFCSRRPRQYRLFPRVSFCRILFFNRMLKNHSAKKVCPLFTSKIEWSYWFRTVSTAENVKKQFAKCYGQIITNSNYKSVWLFFRFTNWQNRSRSNGEICVLSRDLTLGRITNF